MNTAVKRIAVIIGMGTAVLLIVRLLWAKPQLDTFAYLPIVQGGSDANGIQFAVIGDYGNGSAEETAVAKMVTGRQPDFIITTGDNNYPSGEDATIDTHIGQYFSEYIYPYTGIYTATGSVNRFFPALGNHDWYTANAQPYLDYFPIADSAANTGSSQNERYYDFVQGPVHFFMLDSDSSEPDGIADDSVQAVWLQTQLAASTTPWQIVILHHPPYSSGWHGSSVDLRWPFATWGADAVLNGHEHNYERLTHDGIPYFVNGAGGAALRPFLLPLPESEVRYNDAHGAIWAQASDTALTFQFWAVTGGGTLVDAVTVLH